MHIGSLNELAEKTVVVTAEDIPQEEPFKLYLDLSAILGAPITEESLYPGQEEEKISLGQLAYSIVEIFNDAEDKNNEDNPQKRFDSFDRANAQLANIQPDTDGNLYVIRTITMRVRQIVAQAAMLVPQA